MRSSLLVRAGMAFAFLLLAAGCQTAPAPSLSRGEARAMTNAQLTERLVAQLGGLLTAAGPPRAWRPDRGFENAWLVTQPRDYDATGFCTYDRLQLSMAYDDPNADDYDGPAHVQSIESSAWYAYAPEAAPDECARVDPDLFFSSDGVNISLDYDMVKSVLSRLSASAPGFDVKCGYTESCPELTKDLALSHLLDITACRTPQRGQSCRHYRWRGPKYVEMDIYFSQAGLNRQIDAVYLEPGVIL